jgi:hypothetical protein
MRPEVDDLLWLAGDEDGDVSVQCRGCDKGGEPVVFYSTHGSNPYDEVRVPMARTYSEMIRLSHLHLRETHGVPSAREVGAQLVANIGAYIRGAG